MRQHERTAGGTAEGAGFFLWHGKNLQFKKLELVISGPHESIRDPSGNDKRKAHDQDEGAVSFRDQEHQAKSDHDAACDGHPLDALIQSILILR